MAKAKSNSMRPSLTNEKRWQAEDDLRTMQRAKEIQADKSRMAAAKKCANEQMKALKSITGKKK